MFVARAIAVTASVAAEAPSATALLALFAISYFYGGIAMYTKSSSSFHPGSKSLNAALTRICYWESSLAKSSGLFSSIFIEIEPESKLVIDQLKSCSLSLSVSEKSESS